MRSRSAPYDNSGCGIHRGSWGWPRRPFAWKDTQQYGSVPAVWWFSSQEKEDYTKLKAYSSILLHRCMGKVVEKVVAELLSEEVQRCGLLSDRQFRSRKEQSAIDAAAIMVNRAHAAWTNGHMTGGLLGNIKAAFRRVLQGTLVDWMKGKQMDWDHIRWMKSFLSDRTVEMIFEGNSIERHAVEAGVPLGSPVSPILFAIYTSGLIKWRKEYVSAAEELSFVDDLGWVVAGYDVNQVVTILARCAATSIEWASRRRLLFNTAKM